MNRLTNLILLLILITSSVFASTTGKIRGTIIDAESGEPLVGANIILKGTTLGAATNLNGSFIILRVPAGVYNVEASMIGYQSYLFTNVKVEADRTINIDFKLSPEAIESEEIIVTAKRDLVRLDVSASETNIQANDIAELPLASRVEDIIGMQAGVQGNLVEGDLQIRAGDASEVNVLVDGYSTYDSKMAKVSFPINKGSIQEVKVLRGGFNAEYGEARSGVVNIVTKTPSNDFHMSLDYQLEPAGLRHDGPDAYDPSVFWPYRLYDGPNADSASFLVRYEGVTPDTIKWEGWKAYSDRLLNDNNPDNDLSPEEARELWNWRHRPVKYGNNVGHNIDLTLSGGVDFLPWQMNILAGGKYISRPYTYPQAQDAYEETGFSLKLINRLSENTHLTISGINSFVNTVSRDDANSKWSNEVKLSYDGGNFERFYFFNKPKVEYNTTLIGAHLLQVFSPTLYAEFDANYFSAKWETSKYPQSKAEDGRYFGGRLYYDPQSGFIPLELGVSDAVSGYRMYGRANTDDFSSSDRINLKLSMVNQFHPAHELKTGIEFKFNNLIEDRVHIHDDDPSQLFEWKYDVSPIEFSAYVQDKIEFSGMIANVGVRFDYYDANGELPDVTRTLDYATNLDVLNAFLDGTFPTSKPSAKIYVSPRIGISFPITTNSKVYFNYGHFAQIPRTEAMYSTTAHHNFRLQWLGNSNMDFQKSINFELGYDQNVYDWFQLHVGAFYKDYSDVESGIVYAHSDQSIVLESAVQREYREVRGVDIEIRKSIGRFVTGFFNFNITQKSVSDLEVPDISQIPVITDNPAIGIDGELRGVPRSLVEEITPYGRGVIILSAPDDWGPRISDYPILEKTKASISLFYQGPQLVEHPDGDFRVQHPDVKFYTIPYFSSNLRISRGFDLENILNLELYLDISNLVVSKYRTAIPNSKDYYDDLYANGKTDKVGSEDVSDKNILRTESPVLYQGQHRTYILGLRVNI
ncbi:MAG: TonB-dependent receptor [Ignavibacteriales bacterium]|nr:TonB-dependent receptor [Ignavibacteriales bacterium]MCB9208734.1 TonB-dependent receptor [Ignavibacteriales bacterium]